MRRLNTTTTTDSDPAALTDEQRRALAIADAERWRVAVQARDGQAVQLRRGHPARALILLLGGELPPVRSDFDVP